MVEIADRIGEVVTEDIPQSTAVLESGTPTLLREHLTSPWAQSILDRQAAIGLTLHESLVRIRNGAYDLLKPSGKGQPGLDPLDVMEAFGASRDFMVMLPKLVDNPQAQVPILSAGQEGFRDKVTQLIPAGLMTLDPDLEKRIGEEEAIVEPGWVTGPLRYGGAFLGGAIGATPEEDKNTGEFIAKTLGQLVVGATIFGKTLRALTGTKGTKAALSIATKGTLSKAGATTGLVEGGLEWAFSERKVGAGDVLFRGAFGAAIPLVAKPVISGVKHTVQLIGKGSISAAKAVGIVSRVTGQHLEGEKEFLNALRNELREAGTKISIKELAKRPAIQQLFKRVKERITTPIGKTVATLEDRITKARELYEFELENITKNLVPPLRNKQQIVAAVVDLNSRYTKNIQLLESNLRGFRKGAPSTLKQRVPESALGVPLDHLPPLGAGTGVAKASTSAFRRLLAAAGRRGVNMDNLDDMSNLVYGKRTGLLGRDEVFFLTEKLDAEDIASKLFGKHVIAKIPKGLEVDPTKAHKMWTVTPHLFASMDKYLRNFGPMGKVMADKVSQVRVMSSVQFGTLWRAAKDSLDTLSDKEIGQLVKVMEGEITDDQLLKLGITDISKLRGVGAKLQGLMDTVWHQANRLSPIGYIRNYFPHIAKDSSIIFDSAARSRAIIAAAKEHNIPVAQAEQIFDTYMKRHGPREFHSLTRSRSKLEDKMIPFKGQDGNRRDTYDALLTYFLRGSETNQWQLAFGAPAAVGKQLPIVGAFIDAVEEKAGADFGKLVGTMFDRMMGVDFNNTLGNRFLRVMKDINIPLLGQAQILQIGQTGHIASATSLKALYTSLAQKSGLTNELSGFSRKEIAQLVVDSGVIKSVLRDHVAIMTGGTGRMAQGFLRGTGMLGMDDMLRKVAARSAIVHMENGFAALAKGTTKKMTGVWRRDLQKFGLSDKRIDEIVSGQSPLTDLERLVAMNKVANTTQFQAFPEDIPLFWSSRYGRVLTQFKTFAFQHMRFMKDHIVSEMKKGNFRPFAAAIVQMQLTGEIVNDIKMMARDPVGVLEGKRTRADEPTRKVSEAVTGQFQRVGEMLGLKLSGGSWSMVDRAMDNFFAWGGAGLYTDIISSIAFRDPTVGGIEFLGGPTAGTALRIWRIATSVGLVDPPKTGVVERFLRESVGFLRQRTPLPFRQHVNDTLMNLFDLPSRPPR